MSDYTPSIEEIRNHLRSLAHLAGRDGFADAEMFDRALTAHDAAVARKAKAEGLREAADLINLNDFYDYAGSELRNAESAAEVWLRQRADLLAAALHAEEGEK